MRSCLSPAPTNKTGLDWSSVPGRQVRHIGMGTLDVGEVGMEDAKGLVRCGARVQGLATLDSVLPLVKFIISR